MLVDDGGDVVFARTLFEKLISFNIIGFVSQLLEAGGRFRPVYWIYHMLVWVVGRNSYQFHHFAHMVVIGITVYFIYLIIKELTNSKLTSFFASLTYLLIPLNSENIFRLGPQEPLLTMFFSILIYLIIKNKKNFLPCLILVLAVFTKETSVALLPVLFFYYFYGKRSKIVQNKKQGYYLWITVCISSVVLILITFLRRGGYSTNYLFDIQMFIANLSFYFVELSKNTLFVFPLAIIVYLLRLGTSIIKKQKILNSKRDIFEFLFLLTFLCLFLIQIPWKYAIDRYLLPADLFLIIFSFIEVYIDFELLSKYKFISSHKSIFSFLLIFIGLFTALIWGIEIVSREIANVSYYQAFYKMSTLPKNTVILVNMPEGENTIEYQYEIEIQLSEFWNRNDLKVQFLDLQNLPKDNYVIIDSDQLSRTYQMSELNHKFGTPKTTLINSSENIIITTPFQFIKLCAEKIIKSLLYKKRFDFEGIYTYSYNHNNWYFFNE
jgi:hypothetical protein